ncbi:type IV conjugative transfer system protein TraL [Duganella sp. FT92W]|uniref:Type IV conjugative transfer system protein TraL n=1 Tax=Pseudoduganella rivuli TaxID=2666085 RepID=A0A7X2IIM1_9BURK|nr:type IV conjugative transfer system protein TraL [Pseudoduganella rivuli]
MATDTYIPRRLDDQWKIGFWDMDVAMPVLFAIFVGWLAGTRTAFCICVAIGITISRKLSKVKADKHEAYVLHWMYWWLPCTPLTALASTPPSHCRRMIG